MNCSKCGGQLNPQDKFCMKCGTPVANPFIANANAEFQQPFQVQPTFNAVKKEPPYKKWWFWVIIVAAIIVWGGIFGSMFGKEPSSTVKINTSSQRTETPTEKPTEDPKVVEKNFKKSCESIDFKTLSRNPDKYKGKNYVFTGEVIQVSESDILFSDSKQADLRINVTKEEFEYIDEVIWTDTIYATVEIPDSADRILEDDIITFWGTCDGNYKYTSVLGNSVSLPKIDIEYYEISN